MDTIKEYRYPLSFVFGILVCCILILIFLPRREEDVPLTPLSSIVLQLSDLAQNRFQEKPSSSDCNKYLYLQVPLDSTEQSQLECYQVKFVSLDDNIIVLNAIWIFDDPALAILEIDRLIEMNPKVDNIDLDKELVPVILGEESGASRATITGGRVPLYVSNLYWQQGSAVVRLSALNYQGPVDINVMMVLARGIEARLAIR